MARKEQTRSLAGFLPFYRELGEYQKVILYLSNFAGETMANLISQQIVSSLICGMHDSQECWLLNLPYSFKFFI